MKMLAVATMSAVGVLAAQMAAATPVIKASLTVPIAVGGTLTQVDASLGTGNTGFSGTGYSVSYSSVPTNQGSVQNTLSGAHAVPVAGSIGGTTPEYLTGGLFSSLTTNIASSGKYFSTGQTPATITVSFSSAQNSLALLWGSIDTSNQITFFNGATQGDTVTGSTVQGLINGFTTNGSQGVGGSAYVTIAPTSAFTSVQFTSNVVSFEFAGVTASSGGSFAVGIPEPGALGLVGAGLGLVAAVRRTRKAD